MFHQVDTHPGAYSELRMRERQRGERGEREPHRLGDGQVHLGDDLAYFDRHLICERETNNESRSFCTTLAVRRFLLPSRPCLIRE